MAVKNQNLLHFCKFISISIIALSVLGLLGRYYWLFDLVSHFRQYYLISGALLLCLSFYVKSKWVLLTAILIIGINAYFVLSVYSGRQIFTNDQVAITFVSLNVNHDAISPSGLTDLITAHDVDVAVFAETSTTRVAEVQDLLGESYVSEFAPRGGWKNFGVGVIAKKSLDPVLNIEDLAGNGIASISGTFKKDSKSCVFKGIHTMYPFGNTRTDARNNQLFATADKAKGEQCVVVMGDMNITPWSPVFSEVLDRGNLYDSRVGFGVHASWPEWLPYFLRIPIDHALVSQDIFVIHREVLDDVGSDHLPLLVRLQIK